MTRAVETRAGGQSPVHGLRPRIVVLAHRAPGANVAHAGGQLIHRWVRTLAAHADVTVVSPAIAENLDHVWDTDVAHHLIDVDTRRQRGWRRALSAPAELRAGLHPGRHLLGPLTRDPTFQRLVRGADVIECHWNQYLAALPAWRSWNPTAAVSAVMQDVVTQRFERNARVAPSIALRAASAAFLPTLRRAERAALDRCDLAVVLSEKDAAVLEDLGVARTPCVVRPMIDAPVDPPGPAAGGTVLFVAAFDRPDNQFGAEWLLTRVWPRVLSARPDARLVLAGAAPPAHIRSMAGPRIAVTGFVEDLEPVYRAAAVAVAPLRTGAGVKIKVLDAMARGLPVVSTTVGAEGIDEVAGRGAFLAVTDDPADFARAVVAGLSDRDRAARHGRAGVDAVRSAFSPDRVLEPLVERYRSHAARRRSAVVP